MTNFIKIASAISLFCTLQIAANAQSVSINNSGAPANPSSMLDVSSNIKGMLIPRMTKTERNNITSPALGLMVFQTLPDSVGFYFYDGSRWNWMPAAARADSVYWQTHGNTGLTDSTSFLGNIDNVPLNFRVNNQRVGKLDITRFNYSFGHGAGNDLGLGHVSFGDSAGASINNSGAGVYVGYRSGVRNTGFNNNFVGSWSGENTTTGGGNAFFGTGSGQFNSTGFSNAFLGHFAARFNKTGSSNTAIGTQALQNDTSGTLNVAVGYESMIFTTSAYENTAIGSYSLQNHKINPWNVAVGEYTLNQDTSGISNVAIGTSALRNNLNGNNNTALGTNALFSHKRNDFNTAVGYESMLTDTSGTLNVAMGWRSLRYNTNGSENTAIGVGAMENDTTGFGNAALGRYALGFSSKGSYNTAVGYAALISADSSNNSVGVGVNAGYYNTRDNIVAIGNGALYLNSYLQTNPLLGVENSAVGFASGYFANTGSKNT